MKPLLLKKITSITIIALLAVSIFFPFSHALHAQESTATSSSSTDDTAQNQEQEDDGLTTLEAIGIGAGVVAGVTALSQLSNAASSLSSLPFGGKIILIQPVCVSPTAVLINIAVPKPIQLMYIPGVSFSYSYGPPKLPGQSLLGRAGLTPVPCLIPCPAGLCPHPQGGGLPILFHGSSSV